MTEPKVEVIKKNGIKRPESNTITGRLWDIADRISTQEQRPALRKEVVTAYMDEVVGANEATANTQYARWMTYHGCTDAVRALNITNRAGIVAAREKVKAERDAAREAKSQAKIDKRLEKDKIAEDKKLEAQKKREELAAKRKAEKEAKDAAKAEAQRVAKEASDLAKAKKAEEKAPSPVTTESGAAE